MRLIPVLLVILQLLAGSVGNIYYSNMPHLRPRAQFQVSDTLRLNTDCTAQNCSMPLHGSKSMNGSRSHQKLPCGIKRAVSRDDSIIDIPKRMKLTRSESPQMTRSESPQRTRDEED